ncbi:hypothetical protein [Thioclava nitratireducens]|nr:hypothetical protein [Thioclava nitratireducens]
MPEEPNADSKLMEQFIENATPKLLEALTEHVSKQVEESISGLKDASQKMLDEIKDQKRAAAAQAAQDKAEADRLKAMLDRKDDAATINAGLTPEPITLTRMQARDPALYRRAKAQAEKQGTTIQIVSED